MVTRGVGSKRRALLSWLAFAVFVCASTAATPRQGIARSTAPPGPADRLFIAVFRLGSELDKLAQEETNRLLGVCKNYGSVCFSQHFSAIRRSVAVLHASASSASPVMGYVHAVLKVSGEQFGGLTIGLDVELAAKPGQFETWMSTVGDWFYGTYVAGVRPHGNWLQLVGPPFPAQAWVSTEGPSFEALVLPIAGEVLGLQSIRATFPNGARRRIADGAYLIQRSSQTVVEFRAEVPSDMSCDEPVTSPAVMPPTLRAAPAEFFNGDGSARFSYVYQKGC